MADRYPPVEPYATGRLDVGDGHSVYWETVGDPGGVPAVYLHGGPGGGASAGARRMFDPAAYRAVLFDQRGCGRSTPNAAGAPAADGAVPGLVANTTAHLVGDIERLRAELGIERWVIYGVSWGVTLALVYAQAHPERVRAMVLAAVTSGRRLETDWIVRDMGRVFPREWEEFVAPLRPEDRAGNIPAGYARLLTDPDPAISEAAALSWCRWEDIHVSLMPGAQPHLSLRPVVDQLAFARLVTHYWANGSFLSPDQVFAGMPRLAEIPAVLIHGRYDVSGPLDTAWQLHRNWPGSDLVVLEGAGHGGDDFGTAIVAALDRFGR